MMKIEIYIFFNFIFFLYITESILIIHSFLILIFAVFYLRNKYNFFINEKYNVK